MYRYTLSHNTSLVSNGLYPPERLKSEIALNSPTLSLMNKEELTYFFGNELTILFNLARHSFNQYVEMNNAFSIEKNILGKRLLEKKKLLTIGLLKEAVVSSISTDFDVYDYAYFPESFDYRGYFDVLWRGSEFGTPGVEAKKVCESIIHAYAYGHLFILEKDPKHFLNAIQKYPDPHLFLFMLSNLRTFDIFDLIPKIHHDFAEIGKLELLEKIKYVLIKKYPFSISVKNADLIKRITYSDFMDEVFRLRYNCEIGNHISKNKDEWINSENLVSLRQWIGYRMPRLKRFYKMIKYSIQGR